MDIKLGLAVPIYNYRFNRAKKITTTISSKSTTYVTVSRPYWVATSLQRFMGQDKTSTYNSAGLNSVVLGPSTHSSNEGATEYAMVVRTSGNSLYTDRNLKYYYSAGDTATLIGAGLPDGWESTNWDCSPCNIVSDGNYSDMFGLDFSFTMTPFSTSNLYTKIGDLQANGIYRLEIQYANQNSGTVTLSVTNESFSTIASTSLPTTGGSFSTTTLIFSVTASSQSPAYLLLTFTAGTGRVRIANISLTHSPTSASQSVSTFSDLIDLGSLTVTPITGITKVSKTVNGLKYIDSNVVIQKINAVRYKLAFSISNCSQSDFQEFRTLLNWQNRGYLMNFFPGLEGLPHCLTGTFLVQSQRNKITNTNLRDLSIVFEETGVI